MINFPKGVLRNANLSDPSVVAVYTPEESVFRDDLLQLNSIEEMRRYCSEHHFKFPGNEKLDELKNVALNSFTNSKKVEPKSNQIQ